MKKEKATGILWLAIAYTLAIIGAVCLYNALQVDSIIVKYFLSDVLATCIIFAFSRFSGNSSFYDPYWSVQPMVIIIGLLLSDSTVNGIERIHLAGIMVLVYGIRLTYNFLRSWPGLQLQDWRYDDLMAKYGKRYWWVSFGGIHFLPTVLVFGGCLSLFVITMDDSRPLFWLDWLAVLITATAIVIEGVADNQLRDFKKSKLPTDRLLNTRLWSWVRHPNYLGEISFWWGLSLFGIAANPEFWWIAIGPLSIHILFVFVSIPMKDKRMLASRPAYAEHMRKTPALLPFFKP